MSKCSIWSVLTISCFHAGYLLGSTENLAYSLRFMHVYTCQENYSASGLPILTKIYKFLIKNILCKDQMIESHQDSSPSLCDHQTSEKFLQMILRFPAIIDGVQDRASTDKWRPATACLCSPWTPWRGTPCPRTL